MKILFYKIPKENLLIRRKIFSAYAVPHFIWMISTWFFYTDNQKKKITSAFIQGLRIVHNLYGWDSWTTQILTREKTLNDYIYSYWIKFSKHLEISTEATQYQHTLTSYRIIKTIDKSQYKTLGYRKNNKFINRFAERAKHGNTDWIRFEANHRPEYEFFKKSTLYINQFICKYFLLPP